LGEENTFTVAKVLLAVKTQKTADYDENRSAVHKTLIEGFLGLFVCVKWPCVLHGHWKIGKLW